MTAGLLVDGLLVLLLAGLGGWAVLTRDTFAALAGFVGFGLALMLAWMRLGAPDVALTEGAVGGGLSGLLLFGAWARLRGRAADEPSPPAGRGFRVLTGALCAGVALLLAFVVLGLPEPAPTLAPQAHAPLASLGLGNPVPAVLMAYRALDTFLEVFVLLLALVGVWSLAGDRAWGGAPDVGAARHPALTLLARLLPPVGVLVGLYLLWNGSKVTGGEFPAAATLAAMALLVLVAGLARAPAVSGRRLRLALVLGPAVFLGVGLAGMGLAGAFLGYPPGWAKAWILTIEVPLTFSLAAMLVMLLAGPPKARAA
jgi:multisubunit Na+/H+ antiporter MnhB subunit